MANMTITVDERLRNRMRRIKKLNWSKIARVAFEREIQRYEARRAAKKIDKIRSETMTKSWSGTVEIRKWRDKSH